MSGLERWSALELQTCRIQANVCRMCILFVVRSLVYMRDVQCSVKKRLQYRLELSNFPRSGLVKIAFSSRDSVNEAKKRFGRRNKQTVFGRGVRILYSQNCTDSNV